MEAHRLCDRLVYAGPTLGVNARFCREPRSQSVSEVHGATGRRLGLTGTGEGVGKAQGVGQPEAHVDGRGAEGNARACRAGTGHYAPQASGSTWVAGNWRHRG